jgi:hypothetical protein
MNFTDRIQSKTQYPDVIHITSGYMVPRCFIELRSARGTHSHDGAMFNWLPLGAVWKLHQSGAINRTHVTVADFKNQLITAAGVLEH